MKYRLVLKKKQTPTQRAYAAVGGDPGAEAIQRMEAAGYFRQASVEASRPQLPANLNPKLRAALEKLQRATPDPTPSDNAIDKIFGHTPDYNVLADTTERARRKRLGYPSVDDEVFDTFAEDAEPEPQRAAPNRRRRPLFPDAPLSWDDV